MIYLLIQTWIWMLLAALLGLFIGWLIWGRENSSDCVEVRRLLEECKRRCVTLENQQSSIVAEPETPSEGLSVVGSYSASDKLEDGSSDAVDDTQSTTSEESKPTFLTESEGEADDLKKISGIGPVLEKTLNGLGIFHFRQIASFSRENIEWVDNYLSFTGRIDREDWVGQAAKLAEGENTEFANRYDSDS